MCYLVHKVPGGNSGPEWAGTSAAGDWGSDDPYCSCNWGHDPRRDNLEKLKKVSSLRELTS
jgi:hypothetical protein